MALRARLGCQSRSIYSFLFLPEFVLGLAQFAVRDRSGADLGQDQDEKRLEFIFRIYDMDRDGFISSGELFQVNKQLSPSCQNKRHLIVPGAEDDDGQEPD